MATQTMKKSLEKLRKDGYLCAIVENWNSHAGRRNDLFGFLDLLCIKDGEILGVQTTSKNCFSEHVQKIITHKNFIEVKKSGIKITLHGWSKEKVGKRLLWVCEEKTF